MSAAARRCGQPTPRSPAGSPTRSRPMLIAIGILIGLVVGAPFGVLVIRTLAGSRLGAAERTRLAVLAEAKQQAEALRREAQIEAREEAVRLRAEADAEVLERRAQIVKIEERVLSKEEEIDRKLDELVRREQSLTEREAKARVEREEIDG